MPIQGTRCLPVGSIDVRIDLGKYRIVKLPVDEAARFLRILGKTRGYTSDLREALRYLENFDEFYRTLRKRFRDYLAPLKETRDMVLGRVTVDKVRLIVEDRRIAEIMLDRRVPLDLVKNALREIGYEEIRVVEEY